LLLFGGDGAAISARKKTSQDPRSHLFVTSASRRASISYLEPGDVFSDRVMRRNIIVAYSPEIVLLNHFKKI